MLTKNTAVLLKAGPEDGLADGQFTAYASIFGNIDSYGDVVVKGAFTETLAEWSSSTSELPLLFGHNMSDPDYNIGFVTKAEEDDKGLLVTAQLDMDSPKAAQVYRLIKGRRINQMSFAYDIEEASTEKSPEDDERFIYELRKLKLHEISVVPLGANQETEILAVKAATASLLGGIKAGRVISAKNEAELRTAHEAIGNVLAGLDEDDDQEKASGKPDAKAASSDEEPPEAKSPEAVEEQKAKPSVETWATEINIKRRELT